MRLRALLSAAGPFPDAFRGAPLAAQFSSLGSLTERLLLEILDSMSAGRAAGGGPLGRPPPVAGGGGLPGPAGLQLVWPTSSEVQNGIEVRGTGEKGRGRAAACSGTAVTAEKLSPTEASSLTCNACLQGWFSGGSIPGRMANVGKPFLQHYWHRCAGGGGYLLLLLLPNAAPWAKQSRAFSAQLRTCCLAPSQLGRRGLRPPARAASSEVLPAVPATG